MWFPKLVVFAGYECELMNALAERPLTYRHGQGKHIPRVKGCVALLTLCLKAGTAHV